MLGISPHLFEDSVSIHRALLAASLGYQIQQCIDVEILENHGQDHGHDHANGSIYNTGVSHSNQLCSLTTPQCPFLAVKVKTGSAVTVFTVL